MSKSLTIIGAGVTMQDAKRGDIACALQMFSILFNKVRTDCSYEFTVTHQCFCYTSNATWLFEGEPSGSHALPTAAANFATDISQSYQIPAVPSER